MPRLEHVTIQVELITPGVPVWLVQGWAGLPPIAVSIDDRGRFLALLSVRGIRGRLEECGTADGWPSLPALIRGSFPDLFAGD